MEQKPKNLTEEEKRNLSWDEMSKNYWWYKEGERAHLPDSFERFYQENRAKFKDVLDVGCGTGKYLIPMVKDGLNVVGLEPSDGMRKGLSINLKAAKEILKGTVKIVIGESKKLDFPDGSFDFVFSKGAIHHNTLAGIEQSFKEVARVLKTGQFFLFQGRSPKDPDFLSSMPVADGGLTRQDISGVKRGVNQHYFIKEELEQLAKENKLEIVVGPEEIVKDNKRARWWVVYRKI